MFLQLSDVIVLIESNSSACKWLAFGRLVSGCFQRAVGRAVDGGLLRLVLKFLLPPLTGARAERSTALVSCLEDFKVAGNAEKTTLAQEQDSCTQRNFIATAASNAADPMWWAIPNLYGSSRGRSVF